MLDFTKAVTLNGDVTVAEGKERKQLSLAYAARSCTALTRCRDVFRSDSHLLCTSVQSSHSRPSCSHVSHLFAGGLLVHLTASEAARLPDDAKELFAMNGCWLL